MILESDRLFYVASKQSEPPAWLSELDGKPIWLTDSELKQRGMLPKKIPEEIALHLLKTHKAAIVVPVDEFRNSEGGQEKVKIFKRKPSHSEKSAKPQRDYLSDEPKAKGSPLGWVKFPVYFCAGIVGLFLLYRSLGLFQIAFSKFGLGTISNVCPTLGYIPFLGEGLASGCSGLAGLIIGIISLTVLLTVTVLQVLPTLLYFHPQSISDMVYQLRANLRSREFLQHESIDNQEITTLVKRHNTLSDRSLKTLLIFSVLAFCVEAWIVWIARSGRADVGSVLVDSLAFDALVAATLAFRNAFHAKPVKARTYGH